METIGTPKKDLGVVQKITFEFLVTFCFCFLQFEGKQELRVSVTPETPPVLPTLMHFLMETEFSEVEYLSAQR